MMGAWAGLVAVERGWDGYGWNFVHVVKVTSQLTLRLVDWPNRPNLIACVLLDHRVAGRRRKSERNLKT